MGKNAHFINSDELIIPGGAFLAGLAKMGLILRTKIDA